MTIEELKQYKKILILGYGIEGKSVERFLLKFVPDAEIGTADKKDGDGYLEKQQEYDLVIKSPGIPLDKITQKHTTSTNIFFANSKNQVIGITGTKGKSSTAHLTHHVLTTAGRKSWLVGNIGKPALDIFSESVGLEDMIVFELSSYQLEDIAYSPHIACFVNFYPELHNHPSVEAYFGAKKHIIEYQNPEDIFIYNPEFEDLKKLADETKAQKIPFITFDPAETDFIARLNFSEDTLRAVWTIARSLNIPNDTVKEALQSAPSLPHRLQNIGIYHDITFINDSAASHPEATVFALKKLKNVNTLLLGGQERGFDFEPLIKQIEESSIENIVLFPDTQEILQTLLNKSAKHANIVCTGSIEKAVEFAFENTEKGAVCLLSPGAPSYTMFNNFVERGNRFTELVQTYETSHTQKETSINNQLTTE